MEPTSIGLDLAEHVFQVHGVDAAGNVVLKRRLRRGQMITFFAGLAPCPVGMEACVSAHFRARELTVHQAAAAVVERVEEGTERGAERERVSLGPSLVRPAGERVQAH